MTLLDAMTQDLRDEGTITSMRPWIKGSHERTYFELAGYDTSYRGCKTHQIYWDHKQRCLVNRYGKGTRPHAFDCALASVVEAFEAEE
jgi:hypothetical protein